MLDKRDVEGGPVLGLEVDVRELVLSILDWGGDDGVFVEEDVGLAICG
jgi:hypothetical protein